MDRKNNPHKQMGSENLLRKRRRLNSLTEPISVLIRFNQILRKRISSILSSDLIENTTKFAKRRKDPQTETKIDQLIEYLTVKNSRTSLNPSERFFLIRGKLREIFLSIGRERTLGFDIMKSIGF